jgi:hypothetical protein
MFKMVNSKKGKPEWLVIIVTRQKIVAESTSGDKVLKSTEASHNVMIKPKTNKDFKARVLGRL